MSEYFAFQWHITDDCDQRCKHCYIYSENNCKNVDSMNWEQMQEVLAACKDFCQVYHRLPYFYITGGDPILHPDFWRLLALLKSKDIPFTILGNPFHLNDEVCRRMKEYGCQKYQLSLDGMRETHDWFRKPGSFDLTNEMIGCLKRAGIRAVIMTTVSGKNIREIPDIIDTVVAHKVDVFAFARYCPTSEEKDTGMTPMEYRELLAAHAVGLGGCYIGSAWDSFRDPFGQEILKEWEIRTDYYAALHVLLGYPKDAQAPKAKERKDGRIIRK